MHKSNRGVDVEMQALVDGARQGGALKQNSLGLVEALRKGDGGFQRLDPSRAGGRHLFENASTRAGKIQVVPTSDKAHGRQQARAERCRDEISG